MTYLEALRRQKGLKQRELARAIGIHHNAICMAERGWLARPPSGLEDKLKKFFGDAWTFKKLMLPVDPVQVPDND